MLGESLRVFVMELDLQPPSLEMQGYKNDEYWFGAPLMHLLHGEWIPLSTMHQRRIS